MSGFAAKLRWTKNRLAAMSPPEILHRIGEAARRGTDRFRMHRWAASPRDYGPLPEIPGLRDGLAAEDTPETLLNDWKNQAVIAQSGRHKILSAIWPACPREEMWHLDPQTRQTWPCDRFCFKIDYRHASQGGDIKFVWELNRLQYLQPVAALAFKTGDDALADFCCAEIENWIDANPPFLGVNWNSGIELALRLVSFLTVTTLTGARLTRAARGKIWAAVQTHARWIERYPSLYSSANNHRAVEGLGLFLVGSLCPHFPESPRWQKKGWDILNWAARTLILPDGAGAEQATGYAAALLEALLLGLHIARAAQLPVPTAYIRQITRGGETLRALMDASGNIPLIGDDDNACVLGAYRSGEHYAASVLEGIAALTRRADLTPPVCEPHLRQALFGHALAADFMPYGMRRFPHGGFSAARHKSADGDILLVFDHGPLGYGSIAAHGHADTLALWLHKGGQPVFVDAGTYLYHTPGNDRAVFRSTRAHNTLVLDGLDSSLMSGSFNWSRKARATVHDTGDTGAHWHIHASHDGYAPKAKIHRHLHVSPTSGAVIEDWIEANEPHGVEIGFLLHPGLTAQIQGAEILIERNGTFLLRLRIEGPLRPYLEEGAISPEFGTKVPASRLVLRGTLPPGIKNITHLYWIS